MFYHFVRFGPAVGDSVFFFLNSCVDNSSHAHTRRCLCMALFFFIIPCLDILEKKTQIGQGERYDVSRRIRCRYLFSFGWLFSCWQILFFPLFFGWNCSLCWLLMVPLFPPIFVRSWEDDFSLLLLLPLLLLPLPISTITRVTKNTRYTRITKERENVVIPISFFFYFDLFTLLVLRRGSTFLGGDWKFN